MNKTALIIGSTGLVGSYLLNNLLNDGYYQNVISLVRKPSGVVNEKLKEVVCNFDNLDDVESYLVADDFFNCLGTTIKTAGSKEAFFRVDYNYPLQIVKLAQPKGLKRVFMVSSMGANSKSINFYLSVKGKLEEAIASLELECFISFRPSILVGPRKEFRLIESIGRKVASVFDFLMVGPLVNYRAIHAQKVANAMIHWAKTSYKGFKIVPSSEMQQF